MSPPGTNFTAESTEAMQIKYLAQGNNILLPVFEPSTSVTRNRHSNQTTNMHRNLDQFINANPLCVVISKDDIDTNLERGGHWS